MSINAIHSVTPPTPPVELMASVRGSDTPNPQDLARAAKHFEAILVRQLLAPAIEPMMNSSLGGGSSSGGGVYGYMLTDVLATSISQGGGLGLSSVIQTQLTSRAHAQLAPEHHE
jgi:peptidoglycan hydrolase FlgJ